MTEAIQKQEEQAALDEFHSGFGGQTNEPDTQNTSDDLPVETQAETEPPAPEFVQLTKQQFDDMQSRLNEIDDLKKAYAKTSGNLGSLNQVIERIQANTPKGHAVEFTEDDVADLTAEFGEELGAAQLKVLKKISSKLHGTGSQFDPSELEARMQSKLMEALSKKDDEQRESGRETLSEIHPDLPEIELSDDFIKWKEALPIEDRIELNNSMSVRYVAGKIAEYKTFLKEKQNQAANTEKQSAEKEAKAESRRAIVSAAVQPKGDGGHAEPKTANDDFHAGFYGKKQKR